MVDSLRHLGRWFHNVGAATLKDLEVNVLHLVCGITSKLWSRLDLKSSTVGAVLVLKHDLELLRPLLTKKLIHKYTDLEGYALPYW